MTYTQPPLPSEDRCESCSRHAEVEVTFFAEHQSFRLCQRCGDDAIQNAYPAVEAVELL